MRDPTTPGVSAPRRPRVFYGWYIVGASSLSNALLTAAFFTGFQAYFLPILNTFGWSRTAISGAFSLRQFESGLLSPLIGFLVDPGWPTAAHHRRRRHLGSGAHRPQPDP